GFLWPANALPGWGAHWGVRPFTPPRRAAGPQRPRRVHAVDTLRPRVHHDPGLPGQLVWRGLVRHHQEPDGLHAQVAGQPEVLDGYIRLGAVGRDPGHRGAGLAGIAQVVLCADAGDEQHRDLGLGGFLAAGRDQGDLVHPGEAVV